MPRRIPTENQLPLVFHGVRDELYAALSSCEEEGQRMQVLLTRIVAEADSNPFNPIGHVIEHVVPEARALAAPPQPAQEQAAEECQILPLIRVEEVCSLCSDEVRDWAEAGLCDDCAAEVGRVTVAVPVTPPLCPMGGTPAPKLGSF